MSFGYSIGNGRFVVSIWLGFQIYANFQRFLRFIHYPPHSSSASRNPIQSKTRNLNPDNVTLTQVA
jgi:hypothetical protein